MSKNKKSPSQVRTKDAAGSSKTAFIAIWIFVLIVIVLAIIVPLAARKNTADGNESGSNAANISETKTEQYKKGEQVTVGDLGFTVKYSQRVKGIFGDGEKPYTIESDKSVIYVDAELKNDSDAPVKIPYDAFKIRAETPSGTEEYAPGQQDKNFLEEYFSTGSIEVFAFDVDYINDMYFLEIPANKSVSGRLVYIIPENAAKADLCYIEFADTGNVYHLVSLYEKEAD